MMKKIIKIMIADDHDLVREGLKSAIAKFKNIEVVAEAANGNGILSQVKRQPIDLLLLDISMPGPGFLNIMQHLKKKHPEIKILVLSMHPENNYATRVLTAGAEGYIEKNRTNKDLYLAICQIMKGKRYISTQLKEKLFQDSSIGIERPIHDMLSNRELQILLLIGEGKKLSDIASELSLSPKTVSTYRSRLLSKMGLKHNNELIRYAIDNELIC